MKPKTNLKPTDAETLRWQALQDRKGKTAARLVNYPGPIIYIKHARIRSDHYEIYQDGAAVCRGGRNTVGKFLAKLLP